MENKYLISVITPCHNSGKFIHRLLDSVLEQSYPNVEMIMVDNDSQDNTADVINSYVLKFEEKGYILKYILQEDLGPSAGIQRGLREINGDFLLMPDSDDFYNTPYAFEKWISKFNELGEEYAIIRSQLQLVNEEDMKKDRIIYEHYKASDSSKLFEDCLYGLNGYNYAPIGYMVRVTALRETTGLEIFNAYNIGQQRQICLPLYYKYKAYTILEPLVCYLVRKSSISHGDYAKYKTQAFLYDKSYAYIDSILNCCLGMNKETKLDYINRFMQMSSMRMLTLAVKEDQRYDVEKYKNDYIKYGGTLAYIERFRKKLQFKICVRRIIGNKASNFLSSVKDLFS